MASKGTLAKKIAKLRKKKLGVVDRFLLAVLAVGVLVAVALIISALTRIVISSEVDDYLPVDRTVGYLEFQDLSLPTALSSTQEMLQGQLSVLLRAYFNIDYDKAKAEWAGVGFGIAAVKANSGKPYLVLFAVNENKKKALKYFDSLTLREENLNQTLYEETTIYSFPQSRPFSFIFEGPYIFASTSEEVLLSIAGDEVKLSKSEEFKKTFSNLPRGSWMKAFVNVQDLKFGETATVSNIVESLKFTINNAGISVRKKQNGFHFNTFFNLNKDLLELNEESRDRTRFAYELTDYISSKNLAIYIGGANLSTEWRNTLETISNLNPAYGIILESLIRAQVTSIFGEGVSLRNDLYPLFEGEYALATGKNADNRLNFSLILSHRDKAFVNAKMEKLSKGFRLLATRFTPEVNIVTLPDGTESRELIAGKTGVAESTINHQGYDINCVEVNETNYGFCYSATDDLLIMTNNKKLAQESIDLIISPKFVLSQHQPFRQTIGNLSKVSDEITFIDIQEAIPLFTKNAYVILAQPVLSKFAAVSWVKHYFDDGVSAEGFLLIK